MTSTDGLRHGYPVFKGGAPIKVSVAEPALGRIFNVLGEPVDEMGDCDCSEMLPIHKSYLAFTELETKPSIFETGIYPAVDPLDLTSTMLQSVLPFKI
jgi:F-type H+-transporting ATPase subunit beta